MNKKHLPERIDFLNEVVDNETVFYLNDESFNERNPALFLNTNHLNVEGAILFRKEVDDALRLILQ